MGWPGGGAFGVGRFGPLLAALMSGLLAAAALQAEPRWQTAAASAELAAAIGTASPANVEAGALENRVQSIERLSKRDPQRALAELATLNRAGLSARGELRLAAANARIATTQYRMQDALALIDAALPRARWAIRPCCRCCWSAAPTRCTS